MQGLVLRSHGAGPRADAEAALGEVARCGVGCGLGASGAAVAAAPALWIWCGGDEDCTLSWERLGGQAVCLTAGSDQEDGRKNATETGGQEASCTPLLTTKSAATMVAMTTDSRGSRRSRIRAGMARPLSIQISTPRIRFASVWPLPARSSTKRDPTGTLRVWLRHPQTALSALGDQTRERAEVGDGG